MGSIAMPAVPIREEIHLEIDDAKLSEEDILTNTFPTVGDEEAEKVHVDENQMTVEESGAIVRPAIALRDIGMHGQLDTGSVIQDSGLMVSAAVAIRN